MKGLFSFLFILRVTLKEEIRFLVEILSFILIGVLDVFGDNSFVFSGLFCFGGRAIFFFIRIVVSVLLIFYYWFDFFKVLI